MSEDVVVRCQRCGRDGARVAYGWALLCGPCLAADDDE